MSKLNTNARLALKPPLAAELYLIRVQANHNCWISDSNGDPGRTLIKENAELHKDRKIANLLCLALSMDYPNRKFSVERFWRFDANYKIDATHKNKHQQNPPSIQKTQYVNVMSEKLKNGLELTTTLQLAIELIDQYPVKGIIKQKAKDFLKVAENDIANEYSRVYNANHQFAINAVKKKHQLIKIIADFDEADFILCSDFLQKFSDNIEIARKKGVVFFDKIF